MIDVKDSAMLSKSELKALICQRRARWQEQAPDALADRLLDLHARLSGMPNTTLADRLHRRHVDQDISRLQYSLAVDFGLSRGWTLTLTDFSPAVLADRKAGGGHDDHGCWGFTDHTFWYRQGRHAAAVATHPYAVDDRYRTEAARWASARKLSVTYPADFPSWWLPGRTTLVLFTPVLPLVLRGSGRTA